MKLNHLVLAAFMTISAAPAFAANDIETKIVGGVEASIGEFPYIVSLQAGSHFCGGSLIAKNWVLTAGHCVRGISVKTLVVGLHDRRQTVNAELITPARIIPHPNYNPRTLENDFALIQLSENSRYEPIQLVGGEIDIPRDGRQITATTAGWGTLREGGGASLTLQKVDVPLVDSVTCAEKYRSRLYPETMLCAGLPEGGKDACQGDSGGPLIVKNGNTHILAGVVSWGDGCARAKYYGIYSKVSSALNWIARTIN